jgi:tRNA wybutosine-synthesizing protein 3
MPSGVIMVYERSLSKLYQILHISTASLEDAQKVLVAASAAGLRESGAVGLNATGKDLVSPKVAVRSTGLAFDSIIGYQSDQAGFCAIVDEKHLRLLVSIANQRFKVNSERIERFRTGLLGLYPQTSHPREDADQRRLRKREEGLRRREILQSKGRKEALEIETDDLVEGFISS